MANVDSDAGERRDQAEGEGMTESSPRSRVRNQEAERVAHTLNALIGVLYAARVSALIWRRHADRYPIAAKYALQMTGGTILLTLRKFHDLWRSHIQSLLPKNSDTRKKAQWIINEIRSRHLRTTANRLIAHYAAKNSRLPLSETEIVELIKKNAWDTEEELLVWVGPVIWNLIDVRDEIRCRYGVMQSMDDTWMANALDLVVQDQDTARGKRDEPGNG